MSKQINNIKAGLYYRLSQEDERSGESLSIENQKLIVEKFARDNGFEIVDEPEALMARHRGIEVFALSVITDLGIIGRVEKASHEEVLEAAAAAGPQVVDLIYHMIPEI